MDVSKYGSVSEWRDDLNAQGWNISITAGWALQKTIEVLDLSFQEAMDFLVRNEKLAFSGRTVLTDLSFQTLLAEVQEVKKIIEAPPKSAERVRGKRNVLAMIEGAAWVLAYLILVAGITYARIRKGGERYGNP